MNFSEKYGPKSESDLVGKEVDRIKSYLRNPKKGGFLLLLGPTGCGKTSTILALAKDYEILELNASVHRNKASIQEVMGSFCAQMSLFAKKKLVLIDEIDAVSGRHDFGGLAEMIKVIDSSPIPILATANSINPDKMSSLLKKAETVVFNVPSWGDITELLRRICKGENIDFEEEQIKRIAIASGGDIRGAINDLQSLISDNKILNFESVDREKKSEIKNSLSLIFKSKDPTVAKSAISNLNENLIGAIPFPIVYSGEDALMYWLEENIPHEYSKEDTNKAFQLLSNADRFKRRIAKRGYWRFLAYISDFLGPGVALSKGEKNINPTEYKIIFRSPKRNPRLWWISSATKKSVASKLAEKTHISQKQALRELSYIKPLLIQNKDFFEFEDKDMNFLKK
jgi:replication factor C large subunit